MNTIWIIGIGKFGLLAVKRLERAFPNSHFVLVDPIKEQLVKASGTNHRLVQADGISFLVKNLHPKTAPDWIVPALPIHLLAEWILGKFTPEKLKRIKLPINVTATLPNAFRGDNGDIYVSLADFICPDDCPEPRSSCFVTGLHRNQNMFDLLKTFELPGYGSLTVRSHQLTPGVGGYRPEQLFSVLKQVSFTKGRILLSTACRCHGVVTGLKSTKILPAMR
jgi:hypothetical protein